jgi:hypothetical protein
MADKELEALNCAFSVALYIVLYPPKTFIWLQVNLKIQTMMIFLNLYEL